MLQDNFKGTKIEILYELLGDDLYNKFEVDWNGHNTKDCWLQVKLGWDNTELSIWIDDGVIVQVDNNIEIRDIIKKFGGCLKYGRWILNLSLGDPELKEKLVGVCKGLIEMIDHEVESDNDE